MHLQKTLIVDDEPANLSLMESILGADYPLVFARNGAEALAAVTKHQPAMVLLDVGLGEGNGYDLCRKIKRIHSTGCTHGRHRQDWHSQCDHAKPRCA